MLRRLILGLLIIFLAAVACAEEATEPSASTEEAPYKPGLDIYGNVAAHTVTFADGRVVRCVLFESDGPALSCNWDEFNDGQDVVAE